MYDLKKATILVIKHILSYYYKIKVKKTHTDVTTIKITNAGMCFKNQSMYMLISEL